MSRLRVYNVNGTDLEVSPGQSVYLDRSCARHPGRSVSQMHAPLVYNADGTWYVMNRYESSKLVISTDPDGYIFRAPAQVAIPLMSGDSVIYVGPMKYDHEVGITVEGDDSVTAPLVGDTLGDNDYTNATKDVRRILEKKGERRTALLARFQDFLDPWRANPRPLTAPQVGLCAPHISTVVVNDVQKSIKTLTGLDASPELGDWLMHRGILRASDATEIPHLKCDEFHRDR